MPFTFTDGPMAHVPLTVFHELLASAAEKSHLPPAQRDALLALGPGEYRRGTFGWSERRIPVGTAMVSRLVRRPNDCLCPLAASGIVEPTSDVTAAQWAFIHTFDREPALTSRFKVTA